MAPRVIGLDIGTFAVRAAELDVGGDRPTLLNFAQVTLPPGAVVNGEVEDTEAVGAAIRRLWAEGRFRSKQVVVGVANQKVIVRQAEVPAMDEEDMRSALRFEAQELIPIPLEEAILDFQILETVPSSEGEGTARILLAAAQRDMVRTQLAAVERAGLTATTVDLVPFALIRALGGPQEFLPDPDRSQAIVNIGAGVTNVVVHEAGVPRFVRILPVGGDDITRAIAEELDVDVDLAEDLKRRADEASADELEARTGAIVNQRLGTLVEEIRGSLDFYLAQADATPFDRVLVTGGASRTRGLIERLQQALGGTSVEMARPLASLQIGRIGLTDEQLADAEPLIAVPVGLSLAGAPLEKGMRRITLLPSEVTVVREQRRQLTLALSAVAGLFALLLLLWLMRGMQLNREKDKATQSEREVAALQQQVNQLQDLTALQTELRGRQVAAQSLLASDVEWTRLLQDVAVAIPNDVWLTSFVGQKGDAATPGSVTVQAQGFDQTSTARWLLRIGDLSEFSGLWVPTSAKTAGTGGLVTFTSTANLTDAAHSDRAAKYAPGTPQ
jgi:type IV pilus assembly protein PilM